jgi:hypothetical protein
MNSRPENKEAFDVEEYLQRVSKRCSRCGWGFSFFILLMLVPMHFDKNDPEVLQLEISIMAGFFILYLLFHTLSVCLSPKRYKTKRSKPE